MSSYSNEPSIYLFDFVLSSRHSGENSGEGFFLASSFFEAFPNQVEEGTASWELFHSFYKSLELLQAKLLPCVSIQTKLLKRTRSTRNNEKVTWHALSDCLFRTAKLKDYRMLDLLMKLKVPLPVFSQPNRELFQPERKDEAEKGRSSVASDQGDHLPERDTESEAIDQMNQTLIRTLQKVNIHYKELSPESAQEFLSQTADECFFPIGAKTGQTLPAKVFHTVATYGEVVALLNYIVGHKKGDVKVEIDTLPLLLTQDNILQRFSKAQELYKSQWNWLLPHKKSVFIASGFSEDSIGEEFLQELTVDHVREYLLERKVHREEIGNLSFDLLRFLRSTYDQEKHGAKSDYIKRLGSLRYFPVSCNGQRQYCSFNEADQVLHPTVEPGSVASQLLQAMKNLSWPVSVFSDHCFPTTISSKEELFNFFKSACANFAEPHKILKLIHDLQNQHANIVASMENNKEGISELLQGFLKHIQSQGWKGLAKQLPIFFTSWRKCVSVANKVEVVFSREHLEITKTIKSLTVLGSTNDKGFMDTIGIDESSMTEVYISHVITKLPDMDNEEQCIHLEVLLRVVENLERLKPRNNYRQRIANALQSTKFLRNEEGVCHYISQLVLVKTTLQGIVTSLSDQVNTECKKSWDIQRLLEKHGVQTDTSAQKILTYIKTHLVVPHIKSKTEKERVIKFLKALSDEEHHLEDTAFLQELASLKFLPRSTPAWADRMKIVPFDPSVPICFKGSVERDGACFAWTSSPCLEENYFGNPNHTENQRIHSELGITPKGKINHEIMIRNFKEVCCLTEKAGAEAKEKLSDNDYTDLIQKLADTVDVEVLQTELKSFPCILQKDWIFSSPGTTCVEVADDFQPYLWRFPLERGNMLTNFEKFGMHRKPREAHFCQLLQQVAHETRRECIQDPNVTDLVKRAFSELLKVMEKEPKYQMETLFLPTEVDVNGRLRVLKSEELVFDDWPYLRALLKDKGLQFVMRNDLLMSKLELIPLPIRPRRLRDLFQLTVTVADSTRCTDPTCDNFKKLRKLLSSEKFAEALVRLLRHYQTKYKLPLHSTEVSETIRQGLAAIETKCYLSIATNVKELASGEILEVQGREEKKATLIPKSTIGINHDLYYDTERTKAAEEFLSPVVEQLLANLFPEEEYQWEIFRSSIQNMLRATPNTLMDALDQDNIDPMESLVEDNFEELGESIPDDVVAILLTDPYRPLKKNLIVAYEVEEDKFVYARLLDSYEGEVDPSGSIQVDIGEPTPSFAAILDIKFFPLIRETQNGCFALVVKDLADNDDACENNATLNDESESTNSDFENIAATCEKITRQMEEMYRKLNQDEKAWLKFVKRMVFKWHPDKNPGFEEQATEVTKFIQNEAKRIWSGAARPTSGGSSRSWNPRSGFAGTFFEEMFRQWGQWEEQMRSQRSTRDRYYNNFNSRSSFHREEYKESKR